MANLCKCSLQLLGLFKQLFPRAFQVTWVQVFAGQSCCRLFHLEQTERQRRVETRRVKLPWSQVLVRGSWAPGATTSSVRLAKAQVDESAQLGVALCSKVLEEEFQGDLKCACGIHAPSEPLARTRQRGQIRKAGSRCRCMQIPGKVPHGCIIARPHWPPRTHSSCAGLNVRRVEGNVSMGH